MRHLTLVPFFLVGCATSTSTTAVDGAVADVGVQDFGLLEASAADQSVDSPRDARIDSIMDAQVPSEDLDLGFRFIFEGAYSGSVVTNQANSARALLEVPVDVTLVRVFVNRLTSVPRLEPVAATFTAHSAMATFDTTNLPNRMRMVSHHVGQIHIQATHAGVVVTEGDVSVEESSNVQVRVSLCSDRVWSSLGSSSCFNDHNVEFALGRRRHRLYAELRITWNQRYEVALPIASYAATVIDGDWTMEEGNRLVVGRGRATVAVTWRGQQYQRVVEAVEGPPDAVVTRFYQTTLSSTATQLRTDEVYQVLAQGRWRRRVELPTPHDIDIGEVVNDEVMVQSSADVLSDGRTVRCVNGGGFFDLAMRWTGEGADASVADGGDAGIGQTFVVRVPCEFRNSTQLVMPGTTVEVSRSGGCGYASVQPTLVERGVARTLSATEQRYFVCSAVSEDAGVVPGLVGVSGFTEDGRVELCVQPLVQRFEGMLACSLLNLHTSTTRLIVR